MAAFRTPTTVKTIAAIVTASKTSSARFDAFWGFDEEPETPDVGSEMAIEWRVAS